MAKKRKEPHPDFLAAVQKNKRMKVEKNQQLSNATSDEDHYSLEEGEVSSNTAASGRSSMMSFRPKQEAEDDNLDAVSFEKYQQDHSAPGLARRIADCPAILESPSDEFFAANAKEVLRKDMRKRRAAEPTKPYAHILLDTMTLGKHCAKMAQKLLDRYLTAAEAGQLPGVLADREMIVKAEALSDVPQSITAQFVVKCAKKPLQQEIRRREGAEPTKSCARILRDIAGSHLFQKQAQKVLEDMYNSFKAGRLSNDRTQRVAAGTFGTKEEPILVDNDDEDGGAPVPTAASMQQSNGNRAHSAAISARASPPESSASYVPPPAKTPDRSAPYAFTGTVKVRDLPISCQDEQARYFGITDPDSEIRCLSCGVPGHIAEDCPDRECYHCGAVDKHSSSACPTYTKCSRCRSRGHTARTCQSIRTIAAGGPTDPCDYCGGYGHEEEACTALWRSYKPSEDTVKKLPRKEMLCSCFNCGESAHWGNDCPILPDFLYATRNEGPWREKHAKVFIEDERRTSAGDAMDTVQGAHGNQRMWQASLLDDGRD